MLVNVGSLDRFLRIALGIVLIALAYLNKNIDWAWVAVLPLLSGLLRHCPFYAWAGISTCRKR